MLNYKGGKQRKKGGKGSKALQSLAAASKNKSDAAVTKALHRHDKRVTNTYIDSIDAKTPLDFDLIRKMPDHVFETNSDDEDNPNDPELFEHNDLTDWVPPTNEREMEQQNKDVVNGINRLLHTQDQYSRQRYGKPATVQHDITESAISPDTLTRYGQGNSAIIRKTQVEYATQFDSIIDYAYKTLIGRVGYLKKIDHEIMLEFKNGGFWVGNEDHPYLATPQCGQFGLMLLPLCNSPNHPQLNGMCGMIQQNNTVLVKRSITIDNRHGEETYYEYHIFSIDTPINDEDPIFLLTVSKLVNVKPVDNSDRTNPKRYAQSDTEMLDNVKTLLVFVFFTIATT